ncbi:MAG: GLPGLI family protein [Porphyromonas sp.]|nr:GLPGLI family protein [Porphyromonas sp.]
MNPKERKSLLLLLAALLPSLAFAQTGERKVLDCSVVEVIYQLKEKSAPKEKEESSTNNYFTILSAGERVAQFQDYALYQKDSVELLSPPADKESIQKYASKYNKSLHYFEPVISQKLEESRLHMTDVIAIDYYNYSEPFPTWELKEDQPITIAGYSCKKAVIGYGGKVWHAWYTEDIPLQYGPWKLCNLPGLILRAESEDGEFAFNAVVIRQVEREILDTNHLRSETTKRDIFVKKKNEIYTGGRILQSIPTAAISSMTVFELENGERAIIINGARLRNPMGKYLPIEQ